MQGKWHSFASRIYYSLGILYYIYNWLLLTGIIGTLILPFAFYNRFRIIFLISQPSIALMIIGFLFWIKKNKHQLQTSNPNLYLISSEVTYSLLGNNQYGYNRKTNIKAIQHGVDHYDHKFRWTGAGDITYSLLSPGYKMQLFKQSYGPHDVCRIDFERPLRKGEAREINYNLSMIDSANQARPFLSQNIHSNIDRLILRVKFLEDNSIKSCKKQIFMSTVTDIPVWEDTCIIQNSNEIAWSLDKPRPGFRYQISW